MRLQSIIRAIYPPACVACDAPVEQARGLCAACWSETGFVSGLTCDGCGTPLLGDVKDGRAQCDDCLARDRPWQRGGSVMVYEGTGRRLILAFKHGDRTDLVPTFASWLAGRAAGLAPTDAVLVPVPLHWTRLARRRYNQAALLAQATARILGQEVCVDALLRTRRTARLDGHSHAERYQALQSAISCNPKRRGVIAGKPVLLIDDVMTSGATLTAATLALLELGAENVSILTLARVVKAP